MRRGIFRVSRPPRRIPAPLTPVLFPPKPSRRSITIATIVSVAAHLAIFAIPVTERIRGADILKAASQSPLSVVLLPPTPTPQVEPTAQPAPSPVVPTPTVRPPPAPRPAQREVAKAPVPIAPPEPAPAPSPEPPVDMLAMLNAARERRRAATARDSLERSTGEPTPDQIASAAINRNLQSLRTGGEGTSGVFQVLRKGHRTAEFAFNGFRTDRKWREVIEVDAGLGGDVDLAIVRRMIDLIRGHYSGDFNWESHRLGRVVVLSARPVDQAGLEQFLVNEFFGRATLGSVR